MAMDQQAGQLELPLHLREQRAAVAAELATAMQAAQTMDAARLALQRQDFRQALSLLESLQGVLQQAVVQTLARISHKSIAKSRDPWDNCVSTQRVKSKEQRLLL